VSVKLVEVSFRHEFKGAVMILKKSEAKELGNALIDAIESMSDNEESYYICRMDSGQIFSVKGVEGDDHDNGFETLAFVKQ
jgi:CRISPR/Cas system-associated protein Cas7 (RAMP superfamily)